MCWPIQIENTNENNTSVTSGLWPCINHINFMKIIKPQPRDKEGILARAEIELFFHIKWYGAMFWICSENNVDST